MRVVEAINGALHAAMAADADLVVMGEDVLDPYGGAFKATRGLSSAFPGRVLTMPISEGGMVGMATGMAMKGKPVIAEIMFGDFTTLIADQLINHAAKFRWMYDDQVDVPLVVRTPMGGRRGYGPTHSQSLEKHFCGVPGLTVVANHPYADPGDQLRRCLASRTPTLIIENKVMYARPVQPREALPAPANPDVAIISYGGSVELAVAAAARLDALEEISVAVIAVEQLWPFDQAGLVAAVGGCTRVLVVEEGAPGWGFAGECARALIGKVAHFAALAGPGHPVPSCREWEDSVLPGEAEIVAACIALFERD